MCSALVFGICFVTLVFAAPPSARRSLTVPPEKRSVSVPDLEEGKFVRRGDIFELSPQYARRRNLVVGENKIWEDGVVPFFIKEELEERRGKIYTAMNHISARTCIRFRPKTDDDTEYLLIFNGGGCAAHVGRSEREVPVSLGDGCEELIPAAHEIMHSLGVDHTQCRSDRDDYITVHFENIYNGTHHNFRKREDDENQLLVPFDFDSIMLYGPYMASFNGEPAMTANDPNQVFLDTYEKTEMSELDVKGLNKLYKCEKYGSQFAYDD